MQTATAANDASRGAGSVRQRQALATQRNITVAGQGGQGRAVVGA